MSARFPTLIIVTFVLLVGCGAQRDSAPALRGPIVPTRVTSTPAPTETATATATATASATLTVTATATPTFTATFTATPTATPTATVTAAPTLTPEGDTPQVESIPLNAGLPERGEITADIDEWVYTFEAEQGDVVTLRMEADTGTDLDTLLILTDSSGNVLAENDDAVGFGRGVSLIEGYVIPESGVYTVIAARFQRELGSTTGGFALTLTFGDPAANTTPEPQGETVNLIAVGNEVRGEITNEMPEAFYLFAASAGDIITIRMEADLDADLDPLLKLLDVEGSVLAQNDDASGTARRVSLIDNFEIAADGEYVIVAGRFQEEIGSTSGGYTLALARAGAQTDAPNNVHPLEAQALPLTSGEVQTASLDGRRPLAVFSFVAEAGQQVSLGARATLGLSVDFVAILIAPDGRELVRSSARGNIAGVSMISLEQDGEYLWVLAQPAQAARVGLVDVIFQADPLRDLPDNAIISAPLTVGVPLEAALPRTAEGALYTFYAEAGQNINMSVESNVRTLGFTWTVTLPASSEVLAQGRRSDSATFSAPASGYYSLFVRRQLGQGAIRITAAVQ